MDGLYVEKFFKDKEGELPDVSTSTETLQIGDALTASSLDQFSQMLLFFRLLKEDCEKHIKQAPHLQLCLHKLEEAVHLGHHADALVLMDDLEEYLDLIYR